MLLFVWLIGGNVCVVFNESYFGVEEVVGIVKFVWCYGLVGVFFVLLLLMVFFVWWCMVLFVLFVLEMVEIGLMYYFLVGLEVLLWWVLLVGKLVDICFVEWVWMVCVGDVERVKVVVVK